MATYKVLQDIEAEDKLIGPLTLRQCIYAAMAALAGWLAYLVVSKGFPFVAVAFLPFIIFGVFFAFPWSKQQSTEVWALAKIRFALKPRRRIWDQTGVKDLVTVTVPKQVAGPSISDLSETEVRSRLKALADTIDSRGWAIKNVPVGMYNQPYSFENSATTSDRLVEATNLPQEVPTYTTTASEDMLDLANNPLAQQFEAKISASSTAHHQQLISAMNTSAQPQLAADDGQNHWYMSGPTQPAVALPGVAGSQATTALPVSGQLPQAATPTSDEIALAEEIKHKQELYDSPRTASHLRTIQPLSAAPAPPRVTAQNPAPSVTAAPSPAILELANNNDLDVATIAREAQHRNPDASDEVVVSLR
jgi:hypothetical protein